MQYFQSPGQRRCRVNFAAYFHRETPCPTDDRARGLALRLDALVLWQPCVRYGLSIKRLLGLAGHLVRVLGALAEGLLGEALLLRSFALGHPYFLSVDG